MYDDEYDEYYDGPDQDWDDEDEWGCHYPDRCLMSYTNHMRSECHTVEMLEAYEREWNVPWWKRAWYSLFTITYRLSMLRARWTRRGKTCIHCGRKKCDDCQSCDLPF